MVLVAFGIAVSVSAGILQQEAEALPPPAHEQHEDFSLFCGLVMYVLPKYSGLSHGWAERDRSGRLTVRTGYEGFLSLVLLFFLCILFRLDPDVTGAAAAPVTALAGTAQHCLF